ncbi:MAG: hypothetical protein A2297_01255 [Elusimicrobia bacterium RIFOXYB2_FULL_48_7]|nr:MAG: hypothetical protein A2297_01255 [Elusimicrobia bacterium RIFOXYB2_FULL_48_7]
MTKKVLIAEHEWELRNLLKLILEKYDLDVMETEDDQQAVSMIASFKPDALLLDLAMKGFEIVHRLRNEYATQNLPVVMLIDNKAVQDSPIKEYVQDFLLKPFEEEKTMAVLKKILGDVQKKPSGPRAFGSSAGDAEKTVVLSPKDLPSFKMPENRSPESTVQFSAPAEKTVVLSPRDLPSFGQEAPTKQDHSEKTMILTPEEIMSMTRQKPPEPKAPEAVSEPVPEAPAVSEEPAPAAPAYNPESTVQVSNLDKLFGVKKIDTEGTVSIKPEERTSVFAPPPAPEEDEPPAIKMDHVPIRQEEPAEVPAETPVESPAQAPSATRFYSISGIGLKNLLLVLSGESTAEKKTDEASPVLAVVYGEQIDSAQLDTILGVFGRAMQVVTADAARFDNIVSGLQSSGAVIFEIEPSALKRI